MDINPKIFKAYDIRGIYPTNINESVMAEIAKAIYTFFQSKLNKNNFIVALGRDMRLSSPSLHKVTKKTLLAAGANVVDLGLVSTPTFYFAVSHYGYDTGIQITASHNPKEYGGLKFVLNTPNGLLKIGKPTGMDQVKDLATKGVTIDTSKPGQLTENHQALSDEVENALKLFKNLQIKPLTVVADPANGMGGEYISALVAKLPIKLVKMNFDLDGSFPVHQPDPMQPKNLVDLQKKVVAEKADLGLAPDGDGDRLFIINEKGEVVSPSLIIGILAKELLTQFPKSKVVVDLKYTFTPKKIVEENGGELIISKTGHAYITEALTKTGAVFGGEASAHYYYRFTGNAESQVITIIGLLKMLSEKGKSLSVVAEEFRRSFESGEINFETENTAQILEMLKKDYKDGELSTLDGVSFTYPDWRFNVRTSNTEPLLRLNIEAYSQSDIAKRVQELKSKILASGAKLKE